MKVTMSANLGNWVQPTVKHQSETGDRGHQGPRRRAGPSYLRKQKKQAAARAAVLALAAELADLSKKAGRADPCQLG